MKYKSKIYSLRLSILKIHISAEQFQYYYTFAKFVYLKYNHTNLIILIKRIENASMFVNKVFTKKFSKKKKDKIIKEMLHYDKKRIPPFMTPYDDLNYTRL